jgi:hypothetical protein
MSLRPDAALILGQILSRHDPQVESRNVLKHGFTADEIDELASSRLVAGQRRNSGEVLKDLESQGLVKQKPRSQRWVLSTLRDAKRAVAESTAPSDGDGIQEEGERTMPGAAGGRTPTPTPRQDKGKGKGKGNGESAGSSPKGRTPKAGAGVPASRSPPAAGASPDKGRTKGPPPQGKIKIVQRISNGNARSVLCEALKDNGLGDKMRPRLVEEGMSRGGVIASHRLVRPTQEWSWARCGNSLSLTQAGSLCAK